MREALLDILRCPRCKESAFELEEEIRNQLEFSGGSVICKNCRSIYKIDEGIIDFVNDPSEAVARERHAMDEEEYIKDESGNAYRVTEETIEKFRDKFLSLPEGDSSWFFKKGSNFKSISEGSGRFYKTLQDLSLNGNERVLEIGAGFSWASYRFAKHGCSVVALDISNYLKASRVYIEDTYYERMFADMHNTPFKDNTFDIVFGSAVLHHTSQLKDVFSEIRRILKDRGRLVLINESARGIFERIHPDFERLQKRGLGDTSYTILEWGKNVREAGFRKVRIDFLSLADDYITRRREKDSLKLRLAYFVKRHAVLEGFLLFLLIFPRLLFRPKSWRMLCTK